LSHIFELKNPINRSRLWRRVSYPRFSYNFEPRNWLIGSVNDVIQKTAKHILIWLHCQKTQNSKLSTF